MTQPIRTGSGTLSQVFTVRMRPERVEQLRDLAREGANRPSVLIRQMIDRVLDDRAG